MKNRSRSLSLHYADHSFVESVAHRIIYEQHMERPNATYS
jgi:hypothetical protein